MHRIKNKHHHIILILILLFIAITTIIIPELPRTIFLENNYSDILLILALLPGFFIIMGLFEVWVPKAYVHKHLGENSGWKGAIYSFILGSLIPGPFYLSFPMAASMLKKGVSKFNILIFIGAWGAFKVVEEIFEIYFMGFRFFWMRTLITIPFIILTAFIMKRIDFDNPNKTKL